MPLTRYTDPVLEQSPVIARRAAYEVQPRIYRSPMFPKPIASWKKYFGLKSCRGTEPLEEMSGT